MPLGSRHLPSARRLLRPILLLGLIGLLTSFVASGSVRTAYIHALERQAARVTKPRMVLVGDSLMANAGWNWGPGSGWKSVNLAQGGARIAQVATQLSAAGQYGSDRIMILAGVNDLGVRTAEEIEADYKLLLTFAPAGTTVDVVLIPYTSFGQNDVIAAANNSIRRAAESHGDQVMDLNPWISQGGARREAYTDDGLHLNRAAYDRWSEELSRLLTSSDR